MKKMAGVLALLTLAACGRESNPAGPNEDRNMTDFSGVYDGRQLGLTVLWARQRDRVMGVFWCGAALTLSQATAIAGRAPISGFLVISAPCPPQSFNVNGFINADGAIRFTSGGPKPPEGQCPAVAAVEYNGVVVWKKDDLSNTYQMDLSARATADIDCPGPGEGPQRMDYLLRLHIDPRYPSASGAIRVGSDSAASATPRRSRSRLA